jgi:hypothetical protein
MHRSAGTGSCRRWPRSSLRPHRLLLAGLLARDPADRPTAAEARAQLVEALATDADAELPTPDPAADTPFDELEPTAESAVLDDDLPPLPATAPVAQRALGMPQPRRAGALAVALLAPVGLFALALGWPMGSANPILRAPQAVVTAPSTSATRPQTRTTGRITTSSAPSTTRLVERPATKQTKAHGKPEAEASHKTKTYDKPGAGEKNKDKKDHGKKGGDEDV